jgi:hypothetical protein
VHPGYITAMLTVPAQLFLLHVSFTLLIFALMSPLNWGNDVVYYRSMETKNHKNTAEIVSNNYRKETRHFECSFRYSTEEYEQLHFI